jgi:putative ABC transport system permease protein
MQQTIKALVLFPEDWGRVLMVKLSGQHLPQTVAFLESKWKTLAPTRPFEYHFLDEDFNKLYSSELRLGSILNLFAGVAILLACLGLFGLSSYATQQRTKEIGIRKVLGASVASLWVLLSRSFLWLVLIAFLAAAPLAWMATHQWLMSYEYRAPVSWWPFVAAGLGAILLTLATVSFQSIRSALMNPVKGLRME